MKALMIQGCTSDAGKSVLVAALCRVLHFDYGSVSLIEGGELVWHNRRDAI